MTWAGQEKAGGYRESEQIVPTEPKGNRELHDSLGNITTSNQCARNYFNAHH